MVIKYAGLKLDLCWGYHSDGDPYIACIYLEDVQNGPNLINLVSEELIFKLESTYRDQAIYEREIELREREEESAYELEAGK